ncbi:MAG: aminotransferase class V-fold PLP-dependent enzyme [Acidobacteria bacterium]|jgi:aromatic-L-amino-acid decarboxylase|nr:MAG: aminotransferase class V-fold PLP-dependent enzyme [Acidobacteriota bacterium]GIU83021.1 MAG: aromatic-L-amino-acid decarboxylase [Pyrinomonadaceae bacterium]
MSDNRKNLGDIPTEEFRRVGYEIINRIADYLENIEHFPVLSQNRPGDLKKALPQSAPKQGEDFSEILADVEKLIFPAVTHWNHPNFHGLFSTSASAVGIFADMFASAFDMKAMLWRTAPASTELEQVTLEWLRQMLNLPPDFSGIIYDTASVSSLHAIAMARQKAAPQIREEGMNAQPRLKIYCSEQAHSSIEKAVILLGLGRKSLVKIPTDDQFRIQTDELQKAIVQDRNQGFLPFCVVATIGTTSTASVDNVEEIARICGRENCFLHVDAAYAGSAAIIPELQHHFKGWEMADTIVINPHKWLFTPFDLSILYVKDMPLLKQTFSLVPEYLKTSEGDVSEEVVNQMDYGIQLGRRFRSLKLWFAMRYFGQEGMINRIRENCRLAKLFANWIEESPNFQLLAPVHFALVCFRAWREGLSQDELNSINEKIMDKINASGKAYISHTKLNGNLALRLSVGSLRTEERHLKKVWELLNHYLSEELQASA